MWVTKMAEIEVNLIQLVIIGGETEGFMRRKMLCDLVTRRSSICGGKRLS
jgi:hypothetical protein